MQAFEYINSHLAQIMIALTILWAIRVIMYHARVNFFKWAIGQVVLWILTIIGLSWFSAGYSHEHLWWMIGGLVTSAVAIWYGVTFPPRREFER